MGEFGWVPDMTKPRVIILGGGFAGVQCAKTLRKLMSPDRLEIVLFNRENHMVFSPLLAEVVSVGVQAKDVGAPLRQLLTNVHCRTEDVLNIDMEHSFVEYEAYDGKRAPMTYDHLVIACGNNVNLALIPGMDEHAFPLKTIADAYALQSQVMEQMEKAEVCEDPAARREFLSFIIIGGGFSGVEVAGEINDLVRNSCRFFSNIKQEDISVTIVHSRDQLLPEVVPSLREFAKQRMIKAGVKVLLNAHAEHATCSGVTLADKTFLPGQTVVFTAGMAPSRLIQQLNSPHDKGRLITLEDMRLPNFPNAWAIGDCAAIINAHDGAMCPPVGQFAERQGHQVAQNIVNVFNGQPTRPFSFKMLGQLCALGGHYAVADMLGVRISGFPAWFIWRTVYLMKLPSLAQKIRVGLEWGCDLIFPRTLAHLKTDRSSRVRRAYYAAGDLIIRQGDPSTEFFVIHQGEVEVRKTPEGGGTSEVVAVLGAGDFFGEGCLTSAGARSATVAARTQTEVVVLGRNVFSEISEALSPLKEAVAKAAKRRTNIWNNLHEIREVLDKMPLGPMVEPLSVRTLRPDRRVSEAISLINEHRLDSCYVTDDHDKLVGIISRSDLLRAIEVAATMPDGAELTVSVGDIMVKDPITLAITDSTELAVMTMREHGLKTLPVVDSEQNHTIKGYIRIENIMDQLMKRLLVQESDATGKPLRITRQLRKPVIAGQPADK